VDEDYLHYRIASTRYIGEHLRDAGVPILWPPGGHAIYLDARRFASHLEPTRYPGVSVAVGMYVAGGVRACEIGSLMFGHRDAETGQEVAGPRELVRLAIPRRTYTQSHMDYVIEVVVKAFEQRDSLPGYRITEQAGRRFFEDTWKVASEADRIGYRFRGGHPLEFNAREQPFGAGSDPSNIVDSCYPYGSIQVPGGTEPIVLHRDAVSGGGYFMIGTVISADMDLVGQLQPNMPTRFIPIDMAAALAARRERRARIERMRSALA